MSDEVKHYLAVYNQADSTATRLKPVAHSVDGVSPAIGARFKIACTGVQAWSVQPMRRRQPVNRSLGLCQAAWEAAGLIGGWVTRTAE